MVPVFWELLLSLGAQDLMCRYVSCDFEQAFAWGTSGRRSSRNPRRSVSSWPDGFKFSLSVIHTRDLENRKWLVVGMVGRVDQARSLRQGKTGQAPREPMSTRERLGINRKAEVLGNDFLSEYWRGIMVTDRSSIQGAQGLAH